jgi:hypothetical protein
VSAALISTATPGINGLAGVCTSNSTTLPCVEQIIASHSTPSGRQRSLTGSPSFICSFYFSGLDPVGATGLNAGTRELSEEGPSLEGATGRRASRLCCSIALARVSTLDVSVLEASIWGCGGEGWEGGKRSVLRANASSCRKMASSARIENRNMKNSTIRLLLGA